MIDKLSSIPKAVIKASEDAATALAAAAATLAKNNHPYEDRTGDLTRSISSTEGHEENGKVGAEVYATMEYAPFVELGTGKYSKAGEKKFDKLTHTAFSKARGSRPYPFLQPACIAVTRGSKGIGILKERMSALRIAQGLKNEV